MACPDVHTGQRFLADMLGQVDCQAQTIGAYGYGALADPGSVVSSALTVLLTMFIALLGLRLLVGERMGLRDLVGSALKLGIVLTLATSWPAWRTVGYDLVLQGPAEVAASVGLASGLPGSGGELTERLQSVDDDIVILTIYGSGRMTGGRARSDTINDSFRGTALADDQALGWGRVAFLGGVIAPTAAVRLGAGLLLALAPLMAALLLFGGTRDLFFGWLRGLGACAAGAVVLPLIYGVELAVMEPWAADAVAQRGSEVLTPSAPTELLVIGLAFAGVAFAVLALIARIAFFGGFPRLHLEWLPGAMRDWGFRPSPGEVVTIHAAAPAIAPSRAYAIADAVSYSMRREDARERGEQGGQRRPADSARTNAPAPQAAGPTELLGDSFREVSARRSRRASGAGELRDVKS
jgi:type IV secretion system protein VirB6